MLLKIALIFLCVIVQYAATSNAEYLCGSLNDQLTTKCLCRTYINWNTGFPNSLVDCHGSHLTIPPATQQFPMDIGVLDLSLNGIVTFGNLSSKSLETLILAHNRIKYIDKDLFSNLPELEVLDLSHNQISSLENEVIFMNQKKLSHLDLSFNNIQQFPVSVFRGLPLKYLDLSYNRLDDFLTDSNDILGITRNLTTLKLNNIGCKSLTTTFFDYYNNLKHLELADNQFELITLLPNSVEYFDFSGNYLTTISGTYLNSNTLKTLLLRRMHKLASIQAFAFSNLSVLEQLIITDCPKLKEFNELAFGALSPKTVRENSKLKILDLSRNRIQTLNETYKLMFRNMDSIDLRYNPWNCDCNVLWLDEFEDKMIMGEELRCAAPWSLKERSVIRLKPSSLPECYPEIYGITSHRILIILLMIVVIFLAGMVVYTVKYLNKVPGHTLISPFSPYSQAPQIEKI